MLYITIFGIALKIGFFSRNDANGQHWLEQP